MLHIFTSHKNATLSYFLHFSLGLKKVQVLCVKILLLLIHLIQQLMNHRMIVCIINILLDHTSFAVILLTFTDYVLQMFEILNQSIFIFLFILLSIKDFFVCIYNDFPYLLVLCMYFSLFTHADFSYLFGLCISFCV
jgi:hypothetical protein